MDKNNYDEKISQLEVKIRELKDDMEKITKEFLQSTNKYAREWYRTSIENAVIKSPEITKKLGEAKLKELKEELQSLTDNVDQYTLAYVNTDSLWAHRPNYKSKGNETFGLYKVFGNRDPQELSNAIKFLIGKAGQILSKYNYLKGDSPYEKDYSTGNYKYKYGYSWSDEMREVIERYANLFDNYTKLSEELDKVKTEKSENEAKDLWNKI